MIVVVVGIILCISYVVMLNHTSSVVTPITWSEYSTGTRNEIGYLALLQDPNKNSFAYVSLDKEPISTSTRLREGWEIRLLASGSLWNPRICAKVPTVITPNGDIYMFESRRNSAGLYDSYIIWFQPKKNSVSESRIDSGKFIGKTMFIDSEENPYFFLDDNGIVILSVINRRTHQLERVELKVLEDSESVTVAFSKNLLPILDIFDSKNLETKRFTLDNTSLKMFTGDINNKLVTYPDEVHALHDLKNGFGVQYYLDGPYETKILFNKEVVLEFPPTEKIYSYAIGSYKDI